LCSEVGVPLAPDNQDGPIPVRVFLGIVIDITKQEMRLPATVACHPAGMGGQDSLL